MRLPGDERAEIARDFNAKNRHSEINPFFPIGMGGWFETGIDDMFMKWYRQTEANPTPLCIGLVTYDGVFLLGSFLVPVPIGPGHPYIVCCKFYL